MGLVGRAEGMAESEASVGSKAGKVVEAEAEEVGAVAAEAKAVGAAGSAREAGAGEGRVGE